jgi:hypothetical protein
VSSSVGPALLIERNYFGQGLSSTKVMQNQSFLRDKTENFFDLLVLSETLAIRTAEIMKIISSLDT